MADDTMCEKMKELHDRLLASYVALEELMKELHSICKEVGCCEPSQPTAEAKTKR